MSDINFNKLVINTLNTLSSFETKAKELKEKREFNELYDSLIQQLRETKEKFNIIKISETNLTPSDTILIETILKNIFNLEKQYPSKEQQQKVTDVNNALFWQNFKSFKDQLLRIEKNSSMNKKVVKVDKDLLRGS